MILHERIMQRHSSRQWGHCNKTSNWRSGFPRRWILAPKENALRPLSIAPSLLKYDQRDSAQVAPQGLPTWPLPPLWYTLQPILFSDHIRSSISTPRQPLCWQFCVVFNRSNPGCPLQDVTPRTHPSRFHERCQLFLGTAFTWFQHKDGNISVHLCQSELTAFTSHRFLVQRAKNFPTWLHIVLASPLIPLLQFTPSILIFPVEDKSIKELLDASIGLKLAIVLKLTLLSHLLPHTEILPTHYTIRPQFMLSNY